MAKSSDIGSIIDRCLVVLFFKPFPSSQVATVDYMHRLFGVSSEVFNEVKPCPITDVNVIAVFIEISPKSSIMAPFIADQWRRNEKRDPNIEVHMASDFLIRVASKRYSPNLYTNAESAFHAMYKYDPLAALKYQTPQSVNIHVNSSAPSQSPFAFLQSMQALSRPPYIPPPPSQPRRADSHDMFTSALAAAAAASTSGYPMSAPVQSYPMPPTFSSASTSSSSSSTPMSIPHQQQQQSAWSSITSSSMGNGGGVGGGGGNLFSNFPTGSLPQLPYNFYASNAFTSQAFPTSNSTSNNTFGNNNNYGTYPPRAPFY